MKFDPNQPKINYNTKEWESVEEWLARDLQITYDRLASLDTPPERTQQLRGRASLLKQMLDWKKDSAGPIARLK